MPLSQSQIFEEELHKAELGYCLPGSEPFWSHEEIQDILTFLRLIANPLSADCELLQAALTRPDRGVDAGTRWRVSFDSQDLPISLDNGSRLSVLYINQASQHVKMDFC